MLMLWMCCVLEMRPCLVLYNSLVIRKHVFRFMTSKIINGRLREMTRFMTQINLLSYRKLIESDFKYEPHHE